MATHSYRNLKVWLKAMELVEYIYKVAQRLPGSEKFALADQMKRAAVSIPSNIAEGQKRYGKIEMARFCGMALGSTAELETQLILTHKLYNISTETELAICEEISKMLTGLIKALRSKD